MPKVLLTQAQREAEAVKKVRRMLSGKIGDLKIRNHLTYKQIGNEFSVTGNTVSRIANGEELRMNINEFIRFILATGGEIVWR